LQVIMIANVFGKKSETKTNYEQPLVNTSKCSKVLGSRTHQPIKRYRRPGLQTRPVFFGAMVSTGMLIDVADDPSVVGCRVRLGEVCSMPAGFRLDVSGFFGRVVKPSTVPVTTATSARSPPSRRGVVGLTRPRDGILPKLLCSVAQT